MADSTQHLFTPPFPRRPGERRYWQHLYGCADALALAELARDHPGPVMVITPDSLSAQRLGEAIRVFAGDSVEMLNFPDWETLPYDVFSPHQDIISERLTTLYRLPDIRRGILVLPVTTLLQRLPPLDYVQANSLVLEKGQSVDRERLRQRLERSGYRAVQQVMEHGEFCVRGSLFDLFPMGSQVPYRLDFFDDELDSLRWFDPETQRSRSGELEQIRLLPAREFPLTETAIEQFRTAWREQLGLETITSPLYKDVGKGLAPGGIEYYLPLFFEETCTLFDYLPGDSLSVLAPGLLEVSDAFWQEAGERYEQLRHDIERPLLPPQRLFLSSSELFQALKAYPQIHLVAENEVSEDKAGSVDFATQPPPALGVEARAADPVAALKGFIEQFPGRLLFAAETTGRRESLLELLNKQGIRPAPLDDWQAFIETDSRLAITVAPLEQGLLSEAHGLAIISETQLFGERVAQRRRRKATETGAADGDALVRNLTELNLGAPVVHEDYGVGRYLGLVALEIGGQKAEFLHLEYAKQEKLYVPVTSLQLISRFTGVDPERAPLHKLGNPQWEKAKRKAAEQAHDVAAELLELYARRNARQGHIFQHDREAYRAFTQGFPFEETPDQQSAIDAVLGDMHSKKPMDRLVCGDVGFGKTEVAMRAAFVAVQDGKQVAVLVPTTLLAQQHYQTFSDRFADWPVKVEQLSRFRTGKQQTQTLKALAEGQIDIIIGTHKLIQDGIQFNNLGLVIIDEEHRFGVRQKEKFKALRAEVDILTLTATPIPRSLNMALADLRDLSIIATPPSRRLAIKTFVSEWRKPLLSEAILRELKRGGQVYFLHNEVESIEKAAREVAELVPEARVNIAHGQMPERELEQVMRDFYHRRFNVLVCTTIIETGIDVPNANTIIMNRADKLGLAQLYQLRGRVGRSHHRAYAYLITPPKKAMTQDAVKRLEAISALEELGMGFTLATHDLEIRGAGELLGDEQSGHMQEVGFSLYTQMLEQAVLALKEGREPELDRPLDHGTEIDLQVPALIPEDYLMDVHLRLLLYKRIASAPDADALEEIRVEMIDRFGLLPEPTQNLFAITRLKLKAMPLGMRKIDAGEQGGRIQFIEKPPVEPMRVIQLIQQAPQTYSVDAQNNLKFNQTLPDREARIAAIETVIAHLSP